jgi:rhodanese-related sulfurtransferase
MPPTSRPYEQGRTMSITISHLKTILGTPDCPTLIDIRIDDDFNETPLLIPSSIRLSHKNVSEWAGNYSNCVIICHKGLKLSEGVAAILRHKGVKASSLEGGFVAWKAANLMLIPPVKSDLWVTRERPKVDRIACPWLIRRFINRDAVFLYVKASEVLGVADKFDAIPYDVPDVTYTHRGNNCSFDTLLDEFNLHTSALDKLALIIRGADTDNHALHPAAAGLFAISLGLSHQYNDDLAQLETGMHIYDALYCYCRDDEGENHSWKI